MASRLLTPLILCGGTGTRLWPLSRPAMPKQFIPLLGELTTFQATALRVRDPSLFAPPLVITNRNYAGMAGRQLQEIGVGATILIEPMRRDSGPAIAATAAFVAARDPATPILVLPSDHVVRGEAAFRAAAATALAGAEAGSIVTFGIEPDRPATGYGYICPAETELAPGIRKVLRFTEKPDAATAARYIAEGWLWNAGNFVFRADTLLGEYDAFDPVTMNAARRAAAGAVTGANGVELDPDAFADCRARPIDYAVMELSERVAVVPVRMGWSDVGSWSAVWELSDKDESGNALVGDAVVVDGRDNLVRSDQRLVCLVGVEGLAVVATRDAILVFDRRDEGALKKAVAQLEAARHPTVQGGNGRDGEPA